MSKSEKRLDRLCRKPPPTDIRWDEFVGILESLGFTLHEHGGSHKFFVREVDGTEVRINTCRPHPNGIMKSYQIKEVVAKLDEWGLL
ncbi:type II toxin-antitoxin system HicA family toxin [Ralstonia sp. 25mfcol4.1]|uniref:type II toxin-antitoxin system HicA family toxin n=1 Tax=Ralstonia sp. 25mfcol4.1 TaxID=1761899 RepID=UPI000B80FC18